MCDDGCTEKAMATKETANREGNGPPNCRREGFNFILVDDPAPSFFFFPMGKNHIIRDLHYHLFYPAAYIFLEAGRYNYTIRYMFSALRQIWIVFLLLHCIPKIV